MIDFLNTVYKTYAISQKYKDAIFAARRTYEAGYGIDEIVDAFVSNTKDEIDDQMAEALKDYLNKISVYAELYSGYCWKGLTFVEENLPRIAEILEATAITAEKTIPPAIRNIRMGAQILNESSDEICQKLSEAGTFLIKLNLRMSKLRHGSRG